MFSRLFVDASPLDSPDFVLFCGVASLPASDACRDIQQLLFFVLLQAAFRRRLPWDAACLAAVLGAIRANPGLDPEFYDFLLLLHEHILMQPSSFSA
jgi:hypothetical protein